MNHTRAASTRTPIVSGRLHRDAVGGFTVIELMITIAIAAIVLAFAVPSFNRLITNNRQDSVTNSLAHAFRYARGTALRSGYPVTVCPLTATNSTTCSGDWNTGWGVISSPAGASSVTLTANANNTTGITISSSSPASDQIVFTPRGLVTGLPAGGAVVFTFCDKRGAGQATAMVVSRSGYVQFSDQRGTAPNGGALSCP